MKVPNHILHTARNLALLQQGKLLEAKPPSAEDVQALLTWANEGTAKRAAMAAPTVTEA